MTLVWAEDRRGDSRKFDRTKDYRQVIVRLKAKAEGTCDGVGVVIVSGDLPVVANGCPDPRCPLDSNVRIDDEGVVALIRSVKGRRSSVQKWSGGGYRQI